MRIFFALLASCLVAGASTITGTFTNRLTGLPDTNVIRILPVDASVTLANGGVLTIGPAIRIQPDGSGFWSTNLSVGHYMVTNAYLGQGLVFQSLDDTNTYTINQTALSGFNTFVTTYLNTNDVSGGLATNAISIAAGTNTTVGTNGLLATVGVPSFPADNVVEGADRRFLTDSRSNAIVVAAAAAIPTNSGTTALQVTNIASYQAQIATNGFVPAYVTGSLTNALIGTNSVVPVRASIQIDLATSERRSIQSGPTVEPRQEGAIDFASGLDPRVVIDSGANNGVAVESEGDVTIAGGGAAGVGLRVTASEVTLTNILGPGSNTFNGGLYVSGNYNTFVGTEYFLGALRIADGSMLATNATFYTNASGGNALQLKGDLVVSDGITLGGTRITTWSSGSGNAYTNAGANNEWSATTTNTFNGPTVLNGSTTITGTVSMTSLTISNGFYTGTTNAALLGTDSDGKAVSKTSLSMPGPWTNTGGIFQLGSGGNGATMTLWDDADAAMIQVNATSGTNFGLIASGLVADYDIRTLGKFIGTGSGLTNVPSATNAQYVTGTLTNQTYTTNLLGRGYYVTNLLAGTATGFALDASRARNTFITNNNFAISGIQNLQAGTDWQGMLAVSNSAASTIWGSNAPGWKLIGAVSTNALAIPAGKWGYWSVIAGLDTNACNAVSQ